MPLISVALCDRDQFSRGNARKTFGYEAYHWAIVIMPENSRGSDCHAFDCTDASPIDPVTFRMTNPTMDWWFRHRANMEPESSAKLLGRLIIGQIPDTVSIDEIHGFLEKVTRPVKNTHPQQSCVTWVVNAIATMQKQGWVEEFSIDEFKDSALAFADERMKGPNSTEPSVKHYAARNPN